jgi:hypothetical protein
VRELGGELGDKMGNETSWVLRLVFVYLAKCSGRGKLGFERPPSAQRQPHVSSTTPTFIHTLVWFLRSASSHAHVILVNRHPLHRHLCLPGALPQSAILTARPSTLRIGFAICTILMRSFSR